MVFRALPFIAFFCLLSAPSVASSGKISQLIADPHKVVLKLRNEKKPVLGKCGGEFFDLQRTNPNFNELYPLLLTAFSHGWPVKIHTKDCDGGSDRNPVSHAGATNPAIQ